ncbi:glutathione S-transferase family protein [Pseudoalteromonas sp. S16_S37]|uniref:glutathione S-transferase family protein n=1 Tax=Pseudoalteromonas sp. S16_S37 TaxID=2720228 RepID=UPI001681BD05|nr:glutathione S-transferase family protein [Pseudoalteromonas sp. S16_S37]MBD1584779.1 glutathione S-transferase family protein [Pseudoalteromonas sp. S16_S37]
MVDMKFELVAHTLCPYVQRSVITLLEKNVAYTRTDIDLSNKPLWFKQLSPMGKVPLLKVNEHDVLFESAVICEYLDEITPGNLLPEHAIDKARHRQWIEYGSSILNLVAKYYNAESKVEFNQVSGLLRDSFERLESPIVGPYFSGETFSMVDAVYAPIFRYFEVFESLIESSLFTELPYINHWRAQLLARPSVIAAVERSYAAELTDFVRGKDSYLAQLIRL